MTTHHVSIQRSRHFYSHDHRGPSSQNTTPRSTSSSQNRSHTVVGSPVEDYALSPSSAIRETRSPSLVTSELAHQEQDASEFSFEYDNQLQVQQFKFDVKDEEEKPQTDSEEEQEEQFEHVQQDADQDVDRDMERKQQPQLASLVLVESHALVEERQEKHGEIMKIKQFENGVASQQKSTIQIVKDYLIHVASSTQASAWSSLSCSAPSSVNADATGTEESSSSSACESMTSLAPTSLLASASASLMAAGHRLSRFPLHRSAPDVLGRPKLLHQQQLPQQQPQLQQQTEQSLDVAKPLVAMNVLDELCHLVEEEETKATQHHGHPLNHSKKRPRQPTMNQENPFVCEEMILKICCDCLIPVENREAVIAMINKQFGTWQLDVIVLAELVGEHVISFIGMLVFEAMWAQSESCFQRKMHLEAISKLLRHVETRYHGSNPFHNGVHAADVCHTMFTTLKKTRMGELLDTHCQYAAILGAVLHDIEHVGVSNDYLLKTKHEIALKYPTSTPMESMHAAVATELVCSPLYPVLSRMEVQEQAEALMIIQQMIMATALSTQKLLLQEVRDTFHRSPLSPTSTASTESLDTTSSSTSEPECETTSLNSAACTCGENDMPKFKLTLAQQRSLLRCVMHVCDLGHLMKPFDMHHKWVDRLLRENERQAGMWNEYVSKHPESDGGHPAKICCFKETTPKSSTCEMIESQICFLESFALPAVDHLDQITWLGLDGARAGVLKNVREWRARLESFSETTS